ncbi:uncharacterized protein [Typha latifolia]|uniref:uncharacterized protein n=1 Tax=Typha latifolia TaxID=4733 RepID=UPI003C2E38A4
MEVVVVPVQEFQLKKTTTTTMNPFASAPSSPRRTTTNPFELSFPSPNETTTTNPFDLYNHYSSAPASPTRAAAIYAHFNSIVRPSFSTSSTVPFDWEETPGTPKSRDSAANHEDSDFEFDGNPEKGKAPPEPTSADELFEEGRIRPLKPPPPARGERGSVGSSPRSPRVKVAWSPRRRGKGEEEVDPFVAAMAEATKDSSLTNGNPNPSPALPPPSPSQPAPPSTKPTKKWRLSDLLLFRSASDGRVAGRPSKDPIFKYSPMSIFNSSSVSPSPASKRAVGGGESKEATGSSKGKTRRRAEADADADAGTAVTDEEGKKTKTKTKTKAKAKAALHYRTSLMSCFRFNPALHRIGRGFTAHNLTKGQHR